MSETKPIPMRLCCESCGKLHIDEGEFATKPHHTHACQHCGAVWRPAIECTIGVRFLPGFKDDSGFCTFCAASLSSYADSLDGPGRDWSLTYNVLIEPGEYTFKQRLVIDGVFRARKIEIQEQNPLNHRVVVTEIFGKLSSSAPVSGKSCGLHYRDGTAYCNVMFPGGDDVTVRLKNTAKDAVRCTVVVSGRAS